MYKIERYEHVITFSELKENGNHYAIGSGIVIDDKQYTITNILGFNCGGVKVEVREGVIMKNKIAIVSIYIVMIFPIMGLTLGSLMLMLRSSHVFFAITVTLVSLLLIAGLFKGVEHFENK